jgi:hypothetical protein
MSSPGTGSDITPKDANDLLHKLITESIKVEATYSSGSVGLTASVRGLVSLAPDGTLWITERSEIGTPHIAFNPSLAVIRKYGDRRAFKPGGRASSVTPRLTSALCFVFADRSQVGLFEISDEP